MPRLSRNDVADLIATKMKKCSDLQHKSFMELGKLYLQLTTPSAQKQYRARVKTVHEIQKAAQQATQQIKEAAKPAVAPAAISAPESVDDIVRKIEQENKGQQ